MHSTINDININLYRKLVLGTSVDVSVGEVMMDVMFSKNNADAEKND
jgi:hypothetical protein